ncbi:MAG: DUF4382 domain-containing protein [Gammaproteobacteria bacterium]
MKNWVFSLLIALTLGLAGCGSGGGETTTSPPDTTTPPDPTGQVIIGLTDAPGDFLSYQVDVLGIAFTRANGTQIDTLPESTQIDFAQYVDVTELVTAATLPTGTYTAVTLQLDYSNATILAEDNSGQSVEVTAVDASGAPLTTVDIALEFAAADRFVLAPGVPASVTLDFDLEASHKLDLSVSPATAAMDGVLFADTELARPKTRRARGLLRSVDTDASEFTLNVRPFFHPRGDFGALNIETTTLTEFEIDQVTYVGDDGLLALSTLDTGSYVVAFGEHQIGERSVVATRVLAGSSVPFGSEDIATGSVIARSGNELTLRGVTLVREDMLVTFNDTLSVTVSDATVLRQQGSPLTTLTPADISVGQRLTVLGDLDNGTLDATEGLARILYTSFAGTTTSVVPLAVNVSQIGGRRTGLFDFSGTGTAPDTDADPDHYEVDTGSLALDSLTLGAPVRVLGIVAPFGTAPNDFIAQSVGDLTASNGRIHVRWALPGSVNTLTVINDNSLTFALEADELGLIHVLNQSGILRDLLSLGETLTLTADENGRGLFVLRQAGAQMVYFDFATFSAALASALDGSTAVTSVRADVVVADATQYTAQRVVITVN